MIKDWLKDIARLYLPVYQYESEKIRILYAGYSNVKREYFRRMLMPGQQKIRYLGRKWFWLIPRLFKSYEADLVISEISSITSDYFGMSGGFLLPEWTPMKININRPLSEICYGRVSDFNNVKRLIRKYKLTYEISVDVETLETFIRTLYFPYIKKRYGEGAIIVDLKKIWKSFSNPFLLLVKENGVLSSGVLCRIKGDSFYMVALGLTDGNDIFRVHGGIGALYYFCLLEGQKMGLKYLDVGGSHPFFTDRLTRYKLGLGAEFVASQVSWGQSNWLGINGSSQAANDFVRNNPFLKLDKNGRVVLEYQS